jgi:hypothetical protein
MIPALIGLGGSLLAGGASLLAQNNAQGNARGIANESNALQKLLADRQYELATAGRTDARGNKTTYVPGVGWQETPTDTTRGIIGASDAAQRQQLVDMLTRGRGERDLALNRRLEEGKVADPLLQQIKYQFGAPTKEGVVGADKISRVTGVSEQADNTKGAIGSAFLRTGMNINPTALSNVDRGAATGVRKALADADAGADPLYQAHLASFNKGKTDPYNLLATRASNIENIPFQPEQLSGNMDASMANASAVGATRGTAGASEGAYRGYSPLINLANAGGPDYGAFIGGVGENLKNILREYGKSNPKIETESDYSGWGTKGGPRGPGDPWR